MEQISTDAMMLRTIKACQEHSSMHEFAENVDIADFIHHRLHDIGLALRIHFETNIWDRTLQWCHPRMQGVLLPNCLLENSPETTIAMGFETSWELSQVRQKSKDAITRRAFPLPHCSGKGKKDGNPERFGQEPETSLFPSPQVKSLNNLLHLIATL